MPSDKELVSGLTGKQLDVAPKMRSAFMSGLVEYCNRQNKPLHEVIADWWEDDWVAAGNLLTKFMPREVTVDAKVEHNHTFRALAVSRIDDFLVEVTGQGGEDLIDEAPSQDGSILPAPVPAEET